MNAAPRGTESDDVQTDWKWARGHEVKCLKFVRDHLCKINDSSFKQDTQQATDYVLTAPGKVSIAMRIRRIDNTGNKRHLTIRQSRPSGATTELQKIQSGFGDLYCYVWIDRDQRVNEYMLIDLHEMRKSGLLERPDGVQSNRDGSATFSWWHWETLQDYGCIVEGVKHPGSGVEFHIVKKSCSRT